jgi:hypothetical protein
VQVLFCGSFYKTLALPGGFLASTEIVINDSRYVSCGYIFRTSCEILVMIEIVKASLEEKFQVGGMLIHFSWFQRSKHCVGGTLYLSDCTATYEN